ncbi:MAG: ABC transporter substrate-binding protein [Anaerolineales bacterium]|nr:ABC transporter substrate-binding protein [Anaerolineales bacterium]
MYRKNLLILALLISLIVPAGLVTAQDGEKTVVEIYFPIAVDSPITEILNGYAETFEAAHPDVDVVFSFEGAYGDVKTKLLNTIEGGGDRPALAIMLATDIYDLRNADAIQSWDAYATEDYLADFAPTWMTNSYYDFDGDGEGELYGLPFQRSTVLLYYNQTMLEENGLAAPTTWEELATTAQALTTDSRWGILVPNSWPYWVFQPFAAGAGQNIVSESDVDVYFDEQGIIDALQYWLDLFQVYGATPEGVQNNWGDAPGAFTDGNAAMIVHSTGSLPGILGRAEFEVGVSALPGREGGFYTVTGGGNLYLVEGIDDATAAAAWEFVQWLTMPEQTIDWSIQTGYINTRVSGFELEAWQTYVAENPQAAQAAATIDVAVREFSVQDLGEVRNIFHAEILNVLNGAATPAEAMEAAQTGADEILSIYR